MNYQVLVVDVFVIYHDDLSNQDAKQYYQICLITSTESFTFSSEYADSNDFLQNVQ